MRKGFDGMHVSARHSGRRPWTRLSVLRLLLALVMSVSLLALAHTARAQISTGKHPAGHGVINLLLRSRLLQETSGGRLFRQARTDSMVTLEITSTRDVSEAVRSLGGTVKANIAGRVIAARLPASRVEELARQPGVVALFPNEKMHPTLDQSVPEIRANQVWGMSTESGLPVEGAHVLVGVVDSGIDYHNPDFKNPDGSTRIKYIWDQTQDGNAPSGFNFGYECDQASIDNGQCPEKDTDGHGTHVAGTAAGNGLSSNPPREIGVAPQADIIMVKSDLSTDNVLAAWQYLDQKARQLGEPLVVNNSFGGQLGPHDGSEDEDLALDKLAGPGRVFVVAAGNEGHKSIHADGTLTQGATAHLDLHTYSSEAKVRFGLFYGPKNDLALTVTNKSTGETFGPVHPGDKIDGQVSKDGDTKVSVLSGDWDTSHRAAIVTLESAAGKVGGDYDIALTGTTVGGTGRYDAWMMTENAAGFNHADETDTIGIPADARSAITVGNYATRVAWTDMNNQQHNACDVYYCANNTLAIGDIKQSSSVGPTADGRQKPDISAPGTMIVSTLSHDARICSDSSQTGCIDPANVTPDGLNYAESGTSMASPHVTGVAALMLQVNPTLDGNTVNGILRSTARHDGFTGSDAWTPTFGAGKVDAYAAVQTAVAQASSPLSIASVSVEPNGSKLDQTRQSLTTVKAGKKYYLSAYVQYPASLPDNAQRSIQWTVKAFGAASGARYARTDTLRRADYAGKTLRTAVIWTMPKKAGSYTFTAQVTVDGHSDQKFVAFTVQK